ncbi:MAG TPA: hypothetical protein IGR64_14935 [Leptolyngbyaceae cyanobacterium M65_K2018_010]|nr:hypothetical protein [Leptolyngbyaceae cyanobacterium M65_K2018_010]
MMNLSTRYSNRDVELKRQQLETLIQPQPPTNVLVQGWKNLGNRFLQFLTAGSELRIWQQACRGQSIWFAYDPITNQKRSFYSQEDLRIWLDSRYNG